MNSRLSGRRGSSLSPPLEAKQDRAWASSLEATRHSLVSRLREFEDSDAWQRFFDTYAGVILACARNAGLSPTESDEALQETLVSVAKEMPDFRYDPAKGSFKGWLFKITRRRIADQFRRRVREAGQASASLEQVQEQPDIGEDPLQRIWEDEWRQNELQLAVDRVKKKVSARQWQMYDLSALKGWPMERVCATLGVNRAQVYMAKMRIGRTLKAEVRNLPPDVVRIG